MASLAVRHCKDVKNFKSINCDFIFTEMNLAVLMNGFAIYRHKLHSPKCLRL